MLNKEELFTHAMRAAERSAFVDQGFEPVLDRLLTALNTEASLNEVGTGFHSARLRDLLSNRLRMEAWFEKYPEILEETIERPIVVVGLPRTGTTMLHRTIATERHFSMTRARADSSLLECSAPTSKARLGRLAADSMNNGAQSFLDSPPEVGCIAPSPAPP